MNLTILIITFHFCLTVAPGLASYNLDQPLTRVTRPENQVVDFNYDAGGRLQSEEFGLRGLGKCRLGDGDGM